MDEATTRDHIAKHADAVVRGDMDTVAADCSDELPPQLPEIAKALKTRESSLIEDLEHSTRKTIVIQSDPTLHWEQYDIY